MSEHVSTRHWVAVAAIPAALTGLLLMLGLSAGRYFVGITYGHDVPTLTGLFVVTLPAVLYWATAAVGPASIRKRVVVVFAAYVVVGVAVGWVLYRYLAYAKMGPPFPIWWQGVAVQIGIWAVWVSGLVSIAMAGYEALSRMRRCESGRG